MSAFWKLEESRLVQHKVASSAANADSLAIGGGVPLGKIWIVIAFAYQPSVAETQIISVSKTFPGVATYGLLNPVSMNLNPAWATFIEQGMEYMLLPTEFISVYRQAHTAASTMSAFMEFIEIDQPIYTYEEPQIVQRQKKILSSVRSMLGGGVGGGGGIGGGPSSPRGGRSGPLPV